MSPVQAAEVLSKKIACLLPENEDNSPWQPSSWVKSPSDSKAAYGPWIPTENQLRIPCQPSSWHTASPYWFSFFVKPWLMQYLSQEFALRLSKLKLGVVASTYSLSIGEGEREALRTWGQPGLQSVSLPSLKSSPEPALSVKTILSCQIELASTLHFPKESLATADTAVSYLTLPCAFMLLAQTTLMYTWCLSRTAPLSP